LALVSTALAALAPLHENGNIIAGQYLVVLHKNSSMEVVTNLRGYVDDSDELGTFSIGDFMGFSAKLSDAQVLKFRAHGEVQYVERDQTWTLADTCAPAQTGAVWNLVRVWQRSLNLNPANYVYGQTAGNGVDAYIIDTGIYGENTDFGGRSTFGYNAITGETNNDCNGHGTHVAGTVGGTRYGIAKRVSLFAVKVLNCQGSGSTVGIVNGLDWVIRSFQSRRRPSVGNMSLGGGISSALDNGVANTIAAGITVAVAAGNDNANACNYSPARVATAITVGATTNTDARSSFSNLGNCLDIFAPGSSITSDWIGNPTATNTISGTSMASPHVAGVAALYAALNPNASPATVKNWIVSQSTANVVSNPGTGSPNRFLYSPC